MFPDFKQTHTKLVYSVTYFVWKHLIPERLCFSFSFFHLKMEVKGLFSAEGGERLEFRGPVSMHSVQTELAATCMSQLVRRNGKDKENFTLLLRWTAPICITFR